jgi:hypothetical protein
MSDTVKVENQLLQGVYNVFAVNPKQWKFFENNVKNLPRNWLLYPNPFCPLGEMQECDINNPNLQEWLFTQVLPKSGFLIGQGEPH